MLAKAPACLAMCVLGLLLAACEPRAKPGPPAGVSDTRLQWQPAKRSAAPAKTAPVYAVRRPGALHAWTIEESAVRAQSLTQDGDLTLTGGKQHTLRIPLAIDPVRVNLIRVELASQVPMTLRAGLVRSAEGKQSKQRTVAAEGFARVLAGQHQVIEMDLRRLRDQTQAFDQVLLIASGTGLSWSLLSVELDHRPEDGWVPASAGPGELVRCGQETRRAVGLSSRAPQLAKVRIPANGVLSFSYAWPERMPWPKTGASLSLQASYSGQPLLQRSLAFERKDPHWQFASVDLAQYAGEELSLRFSLELAAEELAACVLAELRLGSQPAPKTLAVLGAPTVLLITSDTHRADHTGVSQSKIQITTPAIDRLAAQGVYFEDAYSSSSSITRPSHSALFTSSSPRDTGVIDNNTALGERAETIAERFQDAGYQTWALTSARHLDPAGSGLGQGFERMSWPQDSLDQRAEQTIDTLLRWLPEGAGRPLFVWLHLFDAHHPYDPPKSFTQPYYPADKDPFSSELPEPSFPAPPEHPGLRDMDWMLASYKGEISYLDQQLARVFDVERMTSATIAFTSDHGENLGAHELYWNHRGLYPDVLHVPLILRYPGVPAGTRIRSSVRQIDLGHTLLAIAGLAQAPFPGRDLRQLLEHDQPADRPRFAISSGGANLAIQQGEWLLTLNTRETPRNKLTRAQRKRSKQAQPSFPRHAIELFRISTDPDCLHDLQAQERERAGRMRAALVRWINAPVQSMSAASAQTADASADLAALGYGGDSAPAGSELFDQDCACPECERYR